MKWKRSLLLILTGCFMLISWQINGKMDQDVTLSADTDKNGTQETYHLNKNRLQVWENGQKLWESPALWEVRQILLADADNEGNDELLMVVWKEGSFGKSKPFWLKQEDTVYSCHLYQYRLVAGRMKAGWCSSALDHPIKKLSTRTDNDHHILLEVLEGPAAGALYPVRRLFFTQTSTWQWDGWGFSRTDTTG